jgi:hypothetical protein
LYGGTLSREGLINKRAALRAIATLRNYGLIEEKNGRVIPTPNALDILLYSEDDQKYKRALQIAAITPNVFNKLFTQYGRELPSDEALKAELIKDYDFNPKSVNEVINTYKSTLKEAGSLEKQDIEPTEPMPITPIIKEARGFASNHQRPAGDSEFDRSWSLKGGIIARLQLTKFPPATEDKVFLKMCLERALEELFTNEPDQRETGRTAMD